MPGRGSFDKRPGSIPRTFGPQPDVYPGTTRCLKLATDH